MPLLPSTLGKELIDHPTRHEIQRAKPIQTSFLPPQALRMEFDHIGILMITMGFTPERLLPLFFQEGVGGSRFQCLTVMRRIDIYTSACDCGRHVWNRCLGQDLHTLMEEIGSLSVYLRTLLPQTPSLMFFNVWHQWLLCCEQSEGDLILSQSRCFASDNHSSNPHFRPCFFAPSGLTWLLALPQWHLSSRCKNMLVDDLPKPSHGLPRPQLEGMSFRSGQARVCHWSRTVIPWLMNDHLLKRFGLGGDWLPPEVR